MKGASYGKCINKKLVVDHPRRINDRSRNLGREVLKVMEIKRGKYILRSEPLCLWIDEVVESTDKDTGKTKTYARRVSGYYTDISQLANNFANRTILKSEAKSMNKLLAELKKEKEKIAKLSKEKISEL